MIKIKDFLRDNLDVTKRSGDMVTQWTKIEVIIPTGMEYRYQETSFCTFW